MKNLDPASLVFIDESGFNTKMTRLRGRSGRGTPCVGTVPHGHWQNHTFIAGLRHDRIVAPMLISGPMDGDAFVVWVEQALVPTLGKGDIVICDNLNVHKNATANAVREDQSTHEKCRSPMLRHHLHCNRQSPRCRLRNRVFQLPAPRRI